MVHDENSELYAKREELLEKLRKLVGNEKLMFSDAYVKQCNGYPTLGKVGNEMAYYGISRTYVMCPCRVVYVDNDDSTEYGAMIKKYSLYRSFDGKEVKRIALEDLFVKDLQKIYDDIVFYIWWEATVRLPKVKTQYEACKRCGYILSNIIKKEYGIANEVMR